MTAIAFHSVKLPRPLIDLARAKAEVFRRSTAAQIEYWALFGKAVEESGITAAEAQAAIAPTSAFAAQKSGTDSLDAIEARFSAASASGSLAKRMREVIHANRARVEVHAPGELAQAA